MRRASIRAGAFLSMAALASVAVTTPASATGRRVVNESASQIMTAVQKAEASTSGVHLTGRISQSSTTVSFVLDLTGAGNGKGTFRQSGQTVRVEKMGRNIYVQAGTAFWRSNGAGANAARMGGKWIEAPASNANFASLAQFLGLSRLTTQLFPAGSTPVKKTTTAKVDGHRVVLVVGRATAGGRTETTTLYVAATGKPYVLKALASSSGDVGVLSFTHYGEKVEVRAPAHSLALTSLGNSGTGASPRTTPATTGG
jgi:hypothetical protein